MENPTSSLSDVVLLVDDNQTHQYSLGRHLAKSGFKVLHARTGSEAVALATNDRPDVILMDINLPDMSGFEVCQILRSTSGTRHIPVVFHSATHDTGDARARANALGAIAFLSYPIDIEHLISVVRGSIAKGRRDKSDAD